MDGALVPYKEKEQAKSLEAVLKLHMGNVEKGIFEPKEFTEDMDKVSEENMNPYKCVASLLEMSKVKISGSSNFKILHNVERMIDIIMSKYTVKRPGISDVLFFPNKENEQKLINYIKMAKQSLHIAMFTITNSNLAEALLDCHLRKVQVKIITDDMNLKMKGSDIPDLTREGIQVRTDKNPYALMHNKFVIIDERILVTGSYNWTAQATKMNQENIIVLENDDMAKKFLSEFDVLWKKFEPQNLSEKYGKDIKKTKLYLRYLGNIKKQEELKAEEDEDDDEDDEGDEKKKGKYRSVLSSSKKISKKKKQTNIPLMPKHERVNIAETLLKSTEPQSKVKSGFMAVFKVLIFLMYFFSLFGAFVRPFNSEGPVFSEL